jgi:hypothetical protein
LYTLSDIWEGIGPLGANHSIKQKACLGFLPSWCGEMATIDPMLCVVKFFNDKYQLQRKLNRTELDRFMATLLKQLEVVFNTTFTERIVENVLCKAFRMLKNNNSNKKVEMQCDTLLPGQQHYKFKSNFILVLSPSG